MADLIGAIIETFETAATPSMTVLRSLLPIGSMVADFDVSGETWPFVIVQEHSFNVWGRGIGESWRIDETGILFTIYATSRAAAVELIEAIDNAFTPLVLTGVDNRELCGPPEVTNRLVYRELDCWRAVFALKYTMQK